MVFTQFLAKVWGSASPKMWIESSKVWLDFRPKNWWTAGPPFAVFCCSCDRGTTKWAASLWSDAGGVATVATHGVCDARLRESSMSAVSKRMGRAPRQILTKRAGPVGFGCFCCPPRGPLWEIWQARIGYAQTVHRSFASPKTETCMGRMAKGTAFSL